MMQIKFRLLFDLKESVLNSLVLCDSLAPHTTFENPVERE